MQTLCSWMQGLDASRFGVEVLLISGRTREVGAVGTC